jgi:hypothetical protein
LRGIILAVDVRECPGIEHSDDTPIPDLGEKIRNRIFLGAASRKLRQKKCDYLRILFFNLQIAVHLGSGEGKSFDS